MKWTGCSAIAGAAILTIACTGDGRADRETETEGDDRTAELRSAEESDATGTSGQRDTSHGATGDARHFAEKASIAGNAEVKLGQLAAERAESGQVKEFAQMMVRDHSKSGNELKQAISRHNVAAPASLDDEHQRLYDRLNRLRGAEFDREYMSAMVDGHMKVKSMLSDRAEHTQARADRPSGATGTSGMRGADTQLDAAVNQWAAKTLPTVEQHLQKAQQIRDSVSRGATNRPAQSGNTNYGNKAGSDAGDARR